MEGDRRGINGGSEGLRKGERDGWRKEGGMEGVRNEWTN